MEILATWPLSAWVAILPLAGNALWKPFSALVNLARGRSAAAADREQSEIERLTVQVAALNELVDLLRRALDKHMIRESTVLTFAELAVQAIRQLLDLLDHLDVEPPASVLGALERAVELQRLAQAQLTKINNGGD